MGITARIDSVTRIPADFLVPECPAPKSVKIELTAACNYKCGFCALRTRPSPKNTKMDLGFFKRITAEMKQAGVSEVGVFYLGESLTAPELTTAAIRYLKSELEMPYVFLTTNGSLATPDVVQAIMAAGLDSLKFSVNAGSPEQHKDIMGVKPSLFWDALENIKAARSVRDNGGYHCGVYASSIAYDGEQHLRMQETLDRYVLPYVDQHYWLPMYAEMSSMSQQVASTLGYQPKAGNQGRIGALRDPLPCWACFTEAHVTSDGLLSACCFDANGKFAMADLHDVAFMEGWNSLAFQELRAAHLNKDVTGTICEGCIAYA